MRKSHDLSGKKEHRNKHTLKINTLITSDYRALQGYTMQDLIIKKPITGGKIGKPLKYPDPLEFQRKINQYFDWCDNQSKKVVTSVKDGKLVPKPYTVSGLCVYLQIDSETLSEYGKRPLYSDSVKNAKKRIENWLEEAALTGAVNPIFSIFSFKNNFNWSDKQEVKFNGNLALSTVLKEVQGDEY